MEEGNGRVVSPVQFRMPKSHDLLGGLLGLVSAHVHSYRATCSAELVARCSEKHPETNPLPWRMSPSGQVAHGKDFRPAEGRKAVASAPPSAYDIDPVPVDILGP